jgi:hypothetical protein
MIAFFPEPYEDELAYSIYSRYHIRSGNISAKHTLMELYSTTSVTASMELPSNIDMLINNLPENSSISAEELIYNHTLYPFYSGFMLDSRANEVYRLMCGNNGSRIYPVLGASNKVVKATNVLRFCNECCKDDLEIYGETYWHRFHQIPSLFICLKHRKPLLNSTVEVHIKNRQEYINATMELYSLQYHNGKMPEFKKAIGEKFNDEEIEQIIEKSIPLAQNVKYLLDNNVSCKDMNYFREVYIAKLIEKGYAKRRSLVYQDELLTAFKSFYGEAFLGLAQCNFDVNSSNWVTTISRKHRNGFHPIQHLLFMQFLDITVEEVFTNKIRLIELKGKQYGTKSKEECSRYRQEWLKAIKNNPNKSKTYLKDNNVALYTWLYRHDKKWLDENSPKKKVGIRKGSLIDWNKRDEECLKLVVEQVKSIRESREKPERVTVGLIGRKTKKLTLLQKHLDRMPKTKSYLTKNIEAIEDIQIRRIKWAVKKLSEVGIVSEWEVVRLAGIGKENAIKLKKIILYYMSEL